MGVSLIFIKGIFLSLFIYFSALQSLIWGEAAGNERLGWTYVKAFTETQFGLSWKGVSGPRLKGLSKVKIS